MKVILKESLTNLGTVGDVVTVKDGYARNYLLPQQLAGVETEENIRRIGAVAELFASAGVIAITAFISQYRRIVATAWISLEALGLAEGASRDRLTITSDLAEAVREPRWKAQPGQAITAP